MIPHSNHMLRFKNNIHVEVDYIQKFNSHRIGINQGSRPIFLLALRSLQVVFKQQYRALMDRMWLRAYCTPIRRRKGT